jgi:hypothetical protein
MDDNTEKELQDMEKALSEPEVADNTEKEPDKPESKEEETKEEAKADDSKESDDAEDEEKEPEEPDEDEEAEAPRNPKVPYRKYKVEKEKRQALEATLSSMKADIEAIKANASKSDQKDEIEKLADEYGVDPAFAKKLADNIKGSIKSPLSDDEVEMLRDTKLEKEQNAQFDKEFEELVEINPDAKEHKAKLKKMAFDPKYAGKNFKPLYYIYGKEVKANAVVKTKTAEATNSKKTDTTVLDYGTMEESEALKLSPEKFLEWADYKSTNKS